jgi:hypothetical protein
MAMSSPSGPGGEPVNVKVANSCADELGRAAHPPRQARHIGRELRARENGLELHEPARHRRPGVLRSDVEHTLEHFVTNMACSCSYPHQALLTSNIQNPALPGPDTSGHGLHGPIGRDRRRSRGRPARDHMMPIPSPSPRVVRVDHRAADWTSTADQSHRPRRQLSGCL